MMEVLHTLLLKSGEILRRRLESAHQVEFKGNSDLVTEMDREVEARFLRTVNRHFPEHEVLSEEMKDAENCAVWRKPARQNKIRWIIDPLDGTTNYAHGFPHFAVSAGIERRGKIIMGGVYNPMLRELYFARRGRGAWRNKKRIHVSRTRKLKQALLATGFPYDFRTSEQNSFLNFRLMSEQSRAVRRAGAASLDLCDLAAGRFDGFWELKLKPWDVAAGSLMIEEAGGRITDFHGHRLDIYGGSFLASNGYLHAAMIKVLKGGCGHYVENQEVLSI